mgnify:CR=1 FL=1
MNVICYYFSTIIIFYQDLEIFIYSINMYHYTYQNQEILLIYFPEFVISVEYFDFCINIMHIGTKRLAKVREAKAIILYISIFISIYIIFNF